MTVPEKAYSPPFCWELFRLGEMGHIRTRKNLVRFLVLELGAEVQE